MSNNETLKSLVIYNVEKHAPLGGQHCGMQIPAVIAKSEDLGIEISVKYFKSNIKNKELASLLMDLAIDELIK